MSIIDYKSYVVCLYKHTFIKTNVMNESNGLNENFKSRIGKLHERYIDLINCEPISRKQIKINVPLRGIYLFIENGQAIYVGRSDRMGARLMEHPPVTLYEKLLLPPYKPSIPRSHNNTTHPYFLLCFLLSL